MQDRINRKLAQTIAERNEEEKHSIEEVWFHSYYKVDIQIYLSNFIYIFIYAVYINIESCKGEAQT